MSAIPVVFRSLAMSSLALLLIAPSAEARFGKKSSDSDSSESKGSGRSEQAPPAKTHAATPVSNDDQTEHHRERRHSHSSVVYVAPEPCCYEPAYVASPVVYPPVYASEPYVENTNEPARPYVPENHTVLAAELNPVTEGIGLAASFRLDGISWGFVADGRLLTLGAEDGSANVDSISLANAHLTYALLSGEYGKLRLEAGIASAFAPDLIVAGPSVGSTVTLNLSPWFGFDAGLHGTPFPFRRIEWSAGAHLALGPVGLHTGWRVIDLDDAGLVDGVSHRDVLAGPYAAASLTF